MTKKPHKRPVERGGGEAAAGAPPTSAEKDASRRRAGATSGATSESGAAGSRVMDEHDFKRQKELSPDDFE